MKTDQKEIVTIDATGRSLGRLASEAAVFLRGKHKASFEPRAPKPSAVVITNARAIRLSGKKDQTKKTKFYSGYPGGLKHRSWRERLSPDPERTVRRTVRGMLPNNKWRDRLLKNLKVEL